MVRKLFAVMLVFSFLNLAVVPAFAASNSETEEDRDQQRSVRAAIGLVAIVGVIFMLSNMGNSNRASNSESGDEKKTKAFAKKPKKQTPCSQKLNIFAKKDKEKEQRLKAYLDFSNFGFRQNNYGGIATETKNELCSPEFKISYAW